MGVATAISMYVVIWWLVLFMVLPFGARAPENPMPGHATSAPEKPRIVLKFAITTVISTVVFAFVWWLIGSGLIKLDVG